MDVEIPSPLSRTPSVFVKIEVLSVAFVMSLMNVKSEIIIVGNGLSRKKYNFDVIKGALNCPLYACNLGYSDLPYDKVFAIDDGVILELQKNNIPFVDVPDEMKWEPIAFRGNGPRPRNNTGMVAIQYALNEGFTNLHLFGFDFILSREDQKTSNVFAGHPLYGPETACSLHDSYARIMFLNWMMSQNTHAEFRFYFPDDL